MEARLLYAMTPQMMGQNRTENHCPAFVCTSWTLLSTWQWTQQGRPQSYRFRKKIKGLVCLIELIDHKIQDFNLEIHLYFILIIKQFF